MEFATDNYRVFSQKNHPQCLLSNWRQTERVAFQLETWNFQDCATLLLTILSNECCPYFLFTWRFYFCSLLPFFEEICVEVIDLVFQEQESLKI